ncbi:MAG: magnesium/cobalt transporter CorA [Acidimicrobiia bacterium]|nr:magnesium/cobalt transporter CorA [Acidimicrobiia bacterium]
MIRAFVKGPSGTLEPAAGNPLDLVDADWAWLDLTAPSDDEVFEVAVRFGIDQIAVEDIVEETKFPKVDDFGDHLLLVLHGLRLDESNGVTTHEIDAIVTTSALITFHRDEVPGIDWLIEQASESDAMTAGGPDRMLTRVAEITARRFLPVIDEFDARIDVLEDLAISGHPSVVASTQALRHDALRLRRVLAPQREVVLSLTREGRDVIDERSRLRFGDVYDHLFRLVESLDTARALLAAVVDTYRSTVAENMNDVMKVLTVFSAILLPLSLMAGIYGMNFAHMPELSWRWAYFVLLGIMAATGLGLWIYFSRRGFIGGPRLSSLTRGLERGIGYGIKGIEYGAKGVGAGLKGIVGVGTAPIRLVSAGLKRVIEGEDGDDPPPTASGGVDFG